MVKRCSYGICDSDSRYPERLSGGVQFVPFPKPKTNYEKCLRWIKLCGRPHAQLNVSRINSNRYVCTKHFMSGKWPTKEHPDPLSTDPYTPSFKAHRPSPSKRRRLQFLTPKSNMSAEETNGHQLQDITDHNKENQSSTDSFSNIDMQPCSHTGSQTESTWVDPLDVMVLTAENLSLRQSLAKAALEKIENERKTKTNEEKEEKTVLFSIDHIIDNDKLMKYYTGFAKQPFLNIYKFLVPSEKITPVAYVGKGNLKEIKSITLQNQLLLTLCKLRNDFDLVDLGHRFCISQQTAGVIFNTWVNYMYLRFGEVPTWPHRDIIISNMPQDYRKEFPTTLAILDCTEIKIQKPASLKAQSQTYSDYKSTNTLKALVVVDPRGSVIFNSMLFTGSISDKELFKQCGLQEQLVKLIECGHLLKGDGLMVDKGFKIEELVEDIGLKLNIPPFAVAGKQMSAEDVNMTRTIARHRVHVERAIRRIKSFKIVSNRFSVVHMTSINQIWNVCSFLTNFMPLCIKAA